MLRFGSTIALIHMVVVSVTVWFYHCSHHMVVVSVTVWFYHCSNHMVVVSVTVWFYHCSHHMVVVSVTVWFYHCSHHMVVVSVTVWFYHCCHPYGGCKCYGLVLPLLSSIWRLCSFGKAFIQTAFAVPMFAFLQLVLNTKY